MKIDINNYEAFLLDYIEGNLSAEMTAELMLFLQQNPEIESGIEDFKIVSLVKEEEKFDAKNALKRKEFVVNDDIIEGLIISCINGDLSKSEEKKLMEIVNGNPDYSKLFSQYKKTKLEIGNEKLSDKVLLKGNLPVTKDNAEYFIIAEMEGVITIEEKKSLDKFRAAFPGIKELSLAYSETRLDSAEKIIFVDKSSLKKKEGVVISMWMRYVSVAAAACLIVYFSFFNGANEAQQANSLAETKDSVQNGTAEPKENLLANGKEEIIFEELNDQILRYALVPRATQDDKKLINQNNNSLLVKRNNKKDNPSIPKEPVLDNMAQEEDKNNFQQEENPVMYAREEIKEVKNDDNYALANNTNTNLSSINEDDFISPGQYVRNWAKKTFFTEEAEKNQNGTTTLADNTLRLKGTNAVIQNSEKEDYKEYGFSIGKFGFKRKVRK
jgi:hypothetical protein